MKIPKGYTCACGAKHAYDGYVYVHWRDSLKHVCEACGRTNSIFCGMVRMGKLSAPRKRAEPSTSPETAPRAASRDKRRITKEPK